MQPSLLDSMAQQMTRVCMRSSTQSVTLALPFLDWYRLWRISPGAPSLPGCCVTDLSWCAQRWFVPR
ncbi:hypothetical protein FGO68_gene6501 [Halteria grandinella]|uniref:Uncharacterized protein n=1 Tax=Halteria grandinella TaxID=5974 RepID=A0A8J8SW32_HALGN|nr:hypothetical protein FGO68_gene6501 [Halteria grandinella]